jgi:hypothetical protein
LTRPVEHRILPVVGGGRPVVGSLLALAAAALAVDARASSYDERRAAAVGSCEAIPASRCQSGLLFNPDGCQELEETRRHYLAGHMTLRDFRVELDDNGRDFDLVPVTTGDVPHGYTLRFELVPADGSAAILLHSDGYFVDETPLRIYLRRADLRQRVPDLSPNRRYTITATMAYGLPSANLQAEWSDRFVESVFPARERSQSVTREAAFPAESASRLRPREGSFRER